MGHSPVDPKSITRLTSAGHDPTISPRHWMVGCGRCTRVGFCEGFTREQMLAWLNLEECRPAPRCNEVGPGGARCMGDPNHNGSCFTSWMRGTTRQPQRIKKDNG
jgi:hypothetical protein